ncbi:DUF1559 family PulG-like putative transporter [Planctomicrobium sp. SH664]|uniref:DUF1559 family PulG-like putative transporter n=1 Tax=Planctomicrobium sp. SH664 TaxID=3448125 RepID=UPI003F5B4DB4
MYGDDSGGNIRQIVDGTSRTILLVEACGRNIVWTEPRDVDFTRESIGINRPGSTPGESGSILSSFHSKGSQALMADGTVRDLAASIDPAVLRSLLIKNDGKPTKADDW